jgi:hypothetical protein
VSYTPSRRLFTSSVFFSIRDKSWSTSMLWYDTTVSQLLVRIGLLSRNGWPPPALFESNFQSSHFLRIALRSSKLPRIVSLNLRNICRTVKYEVERSKELSNMESFAFVGSNKSSSYFVVRNIRREFFKKAWMKYLIS